MALAEDLNNLIGLSSPNTPIPERAVLIKELESILLRTEQKHVEEFNHRREAGEIRYHDRECGKITRHDEQEFMHVVKEEYPCGCPKAGIVVRNWWNKWPVSAYMDPTWDFKYLAPRWMENLTGNHAKIVKIGKSFQSLISPFGPPCWEPNCIGSACLERKMRRAGAPEAVGPYEGKPCYIVGSGPSLKKNYKEMSRVTHGVKIAINGAVPLLDQFDMFLTMDWKGASWWSDGQTEKLSKALGLIGWSAHPSILDIPFKDVMLFAQSGKCSWDNWIREVFPWMLDLDRGFSSTFCALHLAVQMGCNPIVFVGCDGCFDADMGMHAAHGDKPQGAEQDIIEHADINGERVKTCVTYYLQNQCLKGACAWSRLHGVNIINATEGGILWMKMAGEEPVIHQMKLSDVVDQYNLIGAITNETEGIPSRCEVQESVR